MALFSFTIDDTQMLHGGSFVVESVFVQDSDTSSWLGYITPWPGKSTLTLKWSRFSGWLEYRVGVIK